MDQIKFGTDGWRAIIADTYTNTNLLRVAEATALYMKAEGMQAAVIGHDCRFAGEMFTELAARKLAEHGITVHRAHGYVSTPMVSLGVVKLKADMGIVITASHNPPSYNGYKLKSAYGGPTIPADIKKVEALIPDEIVPVSLSYADGEKQGFIKDVDLEQMYLDHIYASFDVAAIQKMANTVAYDAMYGAGQNVIKKLLPDAHLLHCEYNPSFYGQAPEPIDRNLQELSAHIASHDEIKVGLANDGDADRIGMYDEDGHFVDSHHLLLLLLYYQYKHKGLSGDVIITFSVTDKMKKLADLFGLKYDVTPIGFKYIAEIMTQRDVLVGGEESGGLAVKGHIPERDGIWNGLMIFEFMAKTGKTLKELVALIYDEVGSFHCDRDDLRITNELKWSIIDTCKENPYKAFGEYAVQRVESMDGYKFYISDDQWIMIRPSGTEPVLRVYAQAENAEKTRALLDATQKTILA